MKRRHSAHRLYVRAVVAIALLIGWGLTALTGFLLRFAPTGPRAGNVPLLLGMTRHEWGDAHFVISVIALCITVVHLVVDWQVLQGLFRDLARADRPTIR